jgi:hypothetical protein
MYVCYGKASVELAESFLFDEPFKYPFGFDGDHLLPLFDDIEGCQYEIMEQCRDGPDACEFERMVILIFDFHEFLQQLVATKIARMSRHTSRCDGCQARKEKP